MIIQSIVYTKHNFVNFLILSLLNRLARLRWLTLVEQDQEKELFAQGFGDPAGLAGLEGDTDFRRAPASTVEMLISYLGFSRIIERLTFAITFTII